MKFLERVRHSIKSRREHQVSFKRLQQTQERYGQSLEFSQEFHAFKTLHQLANRNEPIEWDERYPCLQDKTTETPFDRHYLYHPAWAARVLAKTKPEFHADFSSSLTFCTMVSAFIPVKFYDFRPAPIVLDGLKCGQADLTSLPFENNYFASISCMHVIEHIGLGRYGDPIDPEGDLKALKELIRVLKFGGDLLIAVPVGRTRVQFNAHRIYDHLEFMSYIPEMKLVEFALIPDDPAPDGYLLNPQDALVRQQNYGCGCYWMKKEEC